MSARPCLHLRDRVRRLAAMFGVRATSALKAALSAPANALIDAATHLPRRVQGIVRRDVSIGARFLPYEPDADAWMLPLLDGPPAGRALPVPPQELWLGYGRTPEEYLANGKRDVDKMQEVLAKADVELAACPRILDLGCGAGRMLRWLDAGEREIWGADVSGPHIMWCQGHLSPPYRFLTSTSCPHLPFESRYFDLIYAGSLFTHISDLVETWLLEIRRLLKPGAAAYVTIHDEHTLRALDRFRERPLARRLNAEPPARQFWKGPFGMFTLRRGFNALVFYDDRFIRTSWGRLFDVVSITPEAYDLQSAVV